MDVYQARAGDWVATCAECRTDEHVTEQADGWLWLLEHPCPASPVEDGSRAAGS